MQSEILLRSRRHLNSGQDASVVRTMVAVVKETDVPAGAYCPQKFQQRARPLGKFEAVETLVREAPSVSAHHVPHMQLRHFIVGHVPYREPPIGDAFDERLPFPLPPALP